MTDETTVTGTGGEATYVPPPIGPPAPPAAPTTMPSAGSPPVRTPSPETSLGAPAAYRQPPRTAGTGDGRTVVHGSPPARPARWPVILIVAWLILVAVAAVSGGYSTGRDSFSGLAVTTGPAPASAYRIGAES